MNNYCVYKHTSPITWDCISDIERELNIKVTHITACCNGRQKTAGGYIWKRETNK